MNWVPARRPSTASKYSFNLARSRPPSVSPNSLDYGLQVHTIMASKCISPNSLDHGLQVYLQTRSITTSKCISKLDWSRPPSVSPDSLDYGLQVRTIMASKCISPQSLNHSLQVYLQTRLITTSKCISKVARSRPRSISLSSLDRHFQAHRELLSSTACSQSRYSVCRWVAILLHRYIDENTNWIHDFDSRCCQTCRRRSQVLPGLSSALPVTLKVGRNALLGSDTLLKLTHLSLHSTSSQTLLEACSD